ncbi:RICIN domain-containing protein [Streptomyces sp. NBC_01244]|uniref:RICIN domain-containing protein n=1 Tax=Streptomyces sp. NBC_01244 TaxID=2903797 RepID=UPI002E0DA02C|nr:RICIN domain-containing protein [Streptomyces sp. NBC_01244]
MAAGRPQGTWKGGTEAANELARFLREVTESLTVREMAERYGGGKTAWGQYRSGERIIPLGRLNTVIRDRVRDGRGREAMLKRARRLHDTALTADMRKAPAPRVDEALRRAEADLAESGRLVQSLLAVITMLQETISPLQAAPTGPAVGRQGPPEPEPAAGHLDEAFEQLGAALALRTTARMVHADAQEQSLTAPPVADGSGQVARADRELSLGLAQVGSALEHRRQDVRRLWREIQEESGGGRAVADGVVLERTDTSSAAVVTLARTAGAPAAAAVAAAPAGGRGRNLSPIVPASASAPAPWRGREGRASFLVLVTACALSVITAAAAAIALGRPAVTAPTVYAAPPPGVSPGAVIPGGVTPTPAPSGTTAPAATTSPTASGTSAPPQTVPTTAPPSGSVGSPGPSTSAGPGPTSSGPQPSTPQPSHPVPSGPSPTTSLPPRLPDGFFRLSNAGGGMCLSGPDDSPVPSDGIVQTVCGASPEQFWQLNKERTGPAGTEYSIRNRNGGLCLSVDAARTTNDAFVTEYLCGEGDGLFPDQFWTFRYNTPRHAWQLVNRNSGKCVLVNTDGGDGEQARQGECGDDARMLWRISPAR